MATQTIDHGTLAKLVEAGAVRGAEVVGQPGGWGVVIRYGMTERVLAAHRGTVRIFKRFETLAGYLKDLGIVEFGVNAANYAAGSTLEKRSRPDAAERLHKAHEAAAYSEWFREAVQASLDDPRPSVTHAQAMGTVKARLDDIARGQNAD